MLIHIRKTLGAAFTLIGKGAAAAQSAVAAYFFIKGKLEPEETKEVPKPTAARKKRAPKGRPSEQDDSSVNPQPPRADDSGA